MNSSAIDLSIIIINWNTKELLLETIASVYANLPQPYSVEIIVVDNASSDGSALALVEAYPTIHLIANQENRGFGPANNQALKIAQGRYSLLLNSDVIVQPGSLVQIIEFMNAHPKVGLCGIQILNVDGSFQGSFANYLNLGSEFLILTGLGRRLLNPHYPSYNQAQSQKSKIVQTIQGAFMFSRSSALREIGGLDERFFMYGEENDLSLRLYQAGWLVYYLAEVNIIHLGGQSSQKNWSKMAWQLQQSKVLLFRKHYGPVLALLLKLMVSLAVLTKLFIFQIRRIFQFYSQPQPLRSWFSWSDFRRFWTT